MNNLSTEAKEWIKQLLFLVIFAIFMNGCNEELVSSTLTVEPTISADTLNTDTSYMWLDTTKAEYLISPEKDTLTLYTYHTNGMSAMLRIYDMSTLRKKPASRVIYQDAKGIPRAIMRELDSWLCVDRQYMDRLIQRPDKKRTVKTYYQAIFYVGYDRFRMATNPIACETVSY